MNSKFKDYQNIHRKNSIKNIDDYVSFIEIFTTAGNHTFPKDEDRTWQQTFDRTVT